jgi:hypothetical protein
VRKAAYLFLVVFFTVSPIGLAQVPPGYTDVKEWPDSPEGQKAREAFDVINSNDPERIRTFVDDNFAPELRNIAPMERHIQYLCRTKSASCSKELSSTSKKSFTRDNC